MWTVLETTLRMNLVVLHGTFDTPEEAQEHCDQLYKGLGSSDSCFSLLEITEDEEKELSEESSKYDAKRGKCVVVTKLSETRKRTLGNSGEPKSKKAKTDSNLTIFHVYRGEDHEGNSSLGFFSTLEKALKCVENYTQTNNRAGKKWEQVSDTCWRRGVDVLEISEEIVK